MTDHGYRNDHSESMEAIEFVRSSISNDNSASHGGPNHELYVRGRFVAFVSDWCVL
jgi:hypothetical protein